MNIRLSDGPLNTSEALISRVERKIGRALRAIADRIGEVHVWIRDQGGRSGRGKHCRIVAQVASRRPIVVDSVEADYYRAVDAAAAKLERAAGHTMR